MPPHGMMVGPENDDNLKRSDDKEVMSDEY
jgi:hypothetical protein